MTYFLKRFILAILAFSVLGACSVSALPDDGFGSARAAKGRHFTIYYGSQMDPVSLAGELSITHSDEILARQSPTHEAAVSGELASSVDVLFSLICDVLDMQLYSYKGDIKVCADGEQLAEIYRNLFGVTISSQEIHSFYVFEANTIYITQESFNRKVLGHELGHAIISNYFVVQPSVKVQEVLAGYVEYQLRKTAQ